MRRLMLIALSFIIVFAPAFPVNAFSIGTAPGVQYIGDFGPGESVYVKFYLMTNAKADVLTSLAYIRPHLELYYPESVRGVSAYETSQEDISGWIKFQQNPVLVSPRKSIIATLEGGEVVKANAEIVYKLTIPNDAEPGYHIGSISLAPKVVSSGDGTGVSTLGITRYILIFKVRGVAERNGEIKNIYGDRVDSKRARIDVIFKNTGKDTVSAWVDDMKIYDEFGNERGRLDSGILYVSPGETQVLQTYWAGDNLSGVYKADAKVNYITGLAVKSVSIEIPVEPKQTTIDISKWALPWWLILLVILIIILIIYWKY